jgi:tRNA 2-thiouridine synthesizing protein A
MHVPNDPPPASPRADDEWDAGDLGCGPLVLALRKRLRAMPGRILKITALDPAAPIDLPAWCRLTGNELVWHDNDTKSFWIRSRSIWS